MWVLYTIYNGGSANPTQILVVTGQFDEEFDVEITSLLATYIEEHRNLDDLFDVCLDASPAPKLYCPNVCSIQDAESSSTSDLDLLRSQSLSWLRKRCAARGGNPSGRYYADTTH